MYWNYFTVSTKERLRSKIRGKVEDLWQRLNFNELTWSELCTSRKSQEFVSKMPALWYSRWSPWAEVIGFLSWKASYVIIASRLAFELKTGSTLNSQLLKSYHALMHSNFSKEPSSKLIKNVLPKLTKLLLN